MKSIYSQIECQIKGCIHLNVFVDPVEATLTAEWTSAMMVGMEEAVHHVVFEPQTL